ncbi:BREX system ATP-binding domain-containing protein [Streptosporangium lutulentum]
MIERFVSTALTEAQQTGADPGQVIRARLAHLSETTGGRDLAEVVRAYWRGHDTGDEQLKSAAVRWMRAEFSTTTGARSELGVRTIIDDSTVHDHLKLMSGFVRLASYDGLLVCLDEMDDLCEPASARARDSGSGQILRILDDTLQGGVPHLGFVFAAPPSSSTITRSCGRGSARRPHRGRAGGPFRTGAAPGRVHPGRPLRAAGQAASRPRLR